MDDTKKIVSGIAQRCHGGRLPTDYLVVDIETSGFNYNPPEGKRPDVVVQVGYAAVKDCKLVQQGAHYIKRPRGTMRGKALEITGITDDILHKYGENPRELYVRLIKLFSLYREAQCMFVGHNMISFDAPFLSRELERLGIDFAFKPNEIIDTGCICKAAQMGSLIGPKESLIEYFNRIRQTRSRVKWALEFSIKNYEVDKRFDIDVSKAHDAGVDCYMTHCLLEEFRNYTEAPWA